ncbi:hypothetical protein ACFQ6V_07570 [Streptomyces roseifaciens]
MPAGVLTRHSHEYAYAWLSVLADVPADPAAVAIHSRGLAGLIPAARTPVGSISSARPTTPSRNGRTSASGASWKPASAPLSRPSPQARTAGSRSSSTEVVPVRDQALRAPLSSRNPTPSTWPPRAKAASTFDEHPGEVAWFETHSGAGG